MYKRANFIRLNHQINIHKIIDNNNFFYNINYKIYYRILINKKGFNNFNHYN